MTTKKPSIAEMNEVIARFSGWEKYGDYYKASADFKAPYTHYKTISMKFHISWNWLMWVVEKIEALDNRRFGICIDVLDTMIMDYKYIDDKGEKVIVKTDIYPDNEDTKISITHAAVYKFITWFNQQHKTNE